MTFRQPYGVCAGVIPWNGPIISTIMIAPAVAEGNCIIIKSSEKATLSPLVFAQCAKDAGFPPGVIQFINGQCCTRFAYGNQENLVHGFCANWKDHF
jgi:aldehyde dehydrogenase (NAD+)